MGNHARKSSHIMHRTAMNLEAKPNICGKQSWKSGSRQCYCRLYNFQLKKGLINFRGLTEQTLLLYKSA